MTYAKRFILVHILFKAHLNTEMSKFINAYKSASSRLLKKEFPQIRQKLWKEYFWSQSFCLLTTGGAPIEEVLSKHNICVPSPEDDERESDNMVGLYGSTYYGLLDFVEHTIINLLETYEKCKPEIVTDTFNDFIKEDNNV